MSEPTRNNALMIAGSLAVLGVLSFWAWVYRGGAP